MDLSFLETNKCIFIHFSYTPSFRNCTYRPEERSGLNKIKVYVFHMIPDVSSPRLTWQPHHIRDLDSLYLSSPSSLTLGFHSQGCFMIQNGNQSSRHPIHTLVRGKWGRMERPFKALSWTSHVESQNVFTWLPSCKKRWEMAPKHIAVLKKKKKKKGLFLGKKGE